MTLQPPNLTAFHEAVAEAHSITLYGHYSEREAANILGLSLVMLRRLRKGRQISALRLSPRRVAFFGFQLVEYLLSAMEVATCPATKANETSNSANTGSQNKPAVTHSAEHGSTKPLDRQSAYRSALRILTKPNNG
jgi:hypothetical protein